MVPTYIYAMSFCSWTCRQVFRRLPASTCRQSTCTQSIASAILMSTRRPTRVLPRASPCSRAATWRRLQTLEPSSTSSPQTCSIIWCSFRRSSWRWRACLIHFCYLHNANVFQHKTIIEFLQIMETEPRLMAMGVGRGEQGGATAPSGNYKSIQK